MVEMVKYRDFIKVSKDLNNPLHLKRPVPFLSHVQQCRGALRAQQPATIYRSHSFDFPWPVIHFPIAQRNPGMISGQLLPKLMCLNSTLSPSNVCIDPSSHAAVLARIWVKVWLQVMCSLATVQWFMRLNICAGMLSTKADLWCTSRSMSWFARLV